MLVAPEMFVNVVLSGEACHWIAPVLPDSVIVVPLPLHTVEAVAVAVPPTDVGFTVTAALAEKAAPNGLYASTA